MVCCGSKVKIQSHNLRHLSRLTGEKYREAVEEHIGTKLKLQTSEISSLVKNFFVFADPDTLELDQSQFRQSLGFFGDSYLGERLFYIVKSDNDDVISLKDYLVYYDNLYHGSQEQKWLATYKMIDIEGQGEVKLPEFIHFWKKFVKMYA